ncbi:MAG: class I SAM-dependent methyltransferase [Promethearchaeota archaeon]
MVEDQKIASDKFILRDSIQETMLGPLWARATYSKLYPDLLNDKKAIEIIDKLDYDFSYVKEFLTGKDGTNIFRSLGLLARAKNFDIALLKFMEDRPETTVVNIGAGLDTTFSRVDNGAIKWYDLDLPDAIEFRKQFLPEGPRNKCIEKSVFDESWYEEIKWEKKKGIFFIVGGLVYYFKEQELKKLFSTMARHFQEGEIIFDVVSKVAMRKFNSIAKKLGKDEALYFSVKNPEKLFPIWSDRIQVKDWHVLWTRIELNPSWNKSTKRMIKVARSLKTSKIIHLKFL